MNAHDFVDAVDLASQAMSRLGIEAGALQRAATDDVDANLAAQAVNFATKAGPIGLQHAVERGDPQKLLELQRSTQLIRDDVEHVLIVDAVERFLAFPVAGLLAFTPHEILDEVKEKLQGVKLPTPPQDLPWYVFAGGGAVTGSIVALTATGSPKAMVGGAIGGALLGLGVQWGLDQIGKKFTLF